MIEVYQADVVVIGAGVVGLAAGAALARKGLAPIVVERENLIGSVTSARNSEVIHAGIYYAKDSAKAHHCVAGRRMLYDYLPRHGVGYQKIGKYIVGLIPEDEVALEAIRKRGEVNDAGDIRFVSRAELTQAEPEVIAAAALYSPETGIVDSHGLMLSLVGEIEAAGGAVALGQTVDAIKGAASTFEVHITTPQPLALQAPRVINAAGHGALSLSRRTEGIDAAALPDQRFAKGSYMKLTGRGPFSHLIYPMPVPGALVIHATLDLNGGTRFGPDIEWIDAYNVDTGTADVALFYQAARRYWPGLPDGALTSDYSGVRPKLTRNGVLLDDFLIEMPEEHGLEGLVALYGIESPGLTAALSIGSAIAERLH